MSNPLVSIVTIFLNEEVFLEEAIGSVFQQNYANWELLLVDDGSTDRSTSIAQNFATRYPERVRYFDHPGHANRGMSASRNLALSKAQGTYLAFLDADDAWETSKLSTQVSQAMAAPHLGMLYCTTRYWYSWTGLDTDRERDHLYQPTDEERELDPPHFLIEILKGSILMPCMGSVLIKRSVLVACGGWEDSFRGLYEDQVMISKACMTAPVRVTTECHDLYRQHDQSCCAIAYRAGEDRTYHRQYLRWLHNYVQSHPCIDATLLDLVQQKVDRIPPEPDAHHGMTSP